MPSMSALPMPSRFQPEDRSRLWPRGLDASYQSAVPGRNGMPLRPMPTVWAMRVERLLRLGVASKQ